MGRKRVYFLYSGLGILIISLIVKWLDLSLCCFWILMGVAIALKFLFLVSIFREREFKPSLWLYLILTGVAMILLSLLFKNIIPVPVVYRVLFFGAITLKVSGLIICSRRTN